MKQLLPLAFIAAISIASCKSKTTAITESQKKAKVDSMVGARMQEISTQAMEDLDRRMAIEVKAKADSLVQICMGTKAADTTQKPMLNAEP